MHFVSHNIPYHYLNDNQQRQNKFFNKQNYFLLCLLFIIFLTILFVIIIIIQIILNEKDEEYFNHSFIPNVSSTTTPSIRLLTTNTRKSLTYNETTNTKAYFNCSISLNAKWSNSSIIFAGSYDQCDNDLYHLCQPQDIFIDNQHNKLYIADTKNNRIQMYSLLINDPTAVGITVASQGLINPSGIFVDINTEDMYILDYNKNMEQADLTSTPYYRVHLWHKDDTIGTIVVNQIGDNSYWSFAKIQLDKQLNIYISSHSYIRKYFSSTNYTHGIRIAGYTQGGHTNYDLYDIRGFYLDENSTMYIVDGTNKRIQIWFADSTIGETLVSNVDDLNGITLDCHGRVYWLTSHEIYQYDTSNNQTNKILSGDYQTMQLPFSIKFDQFGNIFVADTYYNRIKKISIL